MQLYTNDRKLPKSIFAADSGCARNLSLLSKGREIANAQIQAVKDVTALLFDDISNTIPSAIRKIQNMTAAPKLIKMLAFPPKGGSFGFSKNKSSKLVSFTTYKWFSNYNLLHFLHLRDLGTLSSFFPTYSSRCKILGTHKKNNKIPCNHNF